jgi:hypothetical protein
MSDIHSCSYYCDRPACIKAQRDELRDRFQVMQAQAEVDAKAQRIAALQHSGEPVALWSLRQLAHEHDGKFHGPNVEHLSIPEHSLLGFANAIIAKYTTPQPVSEDTRDAQRFRQLEDIFAGLKVSRSKNVLEALGFHEADPYGTLAQALLSAGKGTV